MNCCGVKLRLQYPEFCELIKKNDIVCLQETKTDDIDKIDLEGYTFKMKNRKKIGRKSGGIILGYKDHLENYIEPLETESNYIFWFKVSSKLFNLSDDLIFGIVYIPPEDSSYLSPDAFDQVENEDRVLSQNYKYICLLGDFNSRTADDPDFIEIFINEHELDFTQFVENDLAILDTLKIDRKRKRMDAGKNRSGNILLELCRGNNLFIVNGRIGDDYLESGRLTCRNSSVVDYYICSPCFFEYFCNFKVVDFPRLYSDVHSPLLQLFNLMKKPQATINFKAPITQ